MKQVKLLAACLLGALTLANVPAHAQDYPSRPVRMLVPAGAGGPTDLIGRMLAQSLAEQLKTSVVVDNRAGAGGDIGVDAAAKSKPDGYTLLLSHSAPFAYNKQLFGHQPFDSAQDFIPIAQIADAPMLFMVRSNLPVNTVAEFVKLAREKPNGLNFASAGTGLLPHIGIEMLKRRTGIAVVHVPYKSAPAAILAAVSGEADAVFDTPAPLPFVRSGKLKVIGVTSATRSALIPEVATMREQGFTDFDVTAWYGFYAPARTDRAIISRLETASRVLVGKAETKTTLAGMGFEPGTRVGEAFRSFVVDEQNRWSKTISEIAPSLK